MMNFLLVYWYIVVTPMSFVICYQVAKHYHSKDQYDLFIVVFISDIFSSLMFVVDLSRQNVEEFQEFGDAKGIN